MGHCMSQQHAGRMAAPAAPVAIASGFDELPDEVRQEIREKQKQARAKKKAAKLAKAEGDALGAPTEGDSPVDEDMAKHYPTLLSKDEYFGACRAGLFRQTGFKATEANIAILMDMDFSQVVGHDRQGKPICLADFNYFQFEGSNDEIWDPIFLARLAHEGFFTITTGRFRGEPEPLPELQPFYGVLDWPDMNRSKAVRKALRRVSEASSQNKDYRLYCNKHLDLTYELLDKYQKEQHGCNWMTRKYFETCRRASDDPRINFHLHSIELYDGQFLEDSSKPSCNGAPCMLAGEIGYSIGHVYTSLSGFSTRDAEGFGWLQLACLGKWLEYRGYAFWSLGHCYSPQMEYKRQLGHRIYPRADFLARLKKHTGDFRVKDNTGTPADGSFMALSDGEACDFGVVLKAPSAS
eukprot:TRINITY_DN105699_c0_g1_i1.p1 TRINITY_DN105699_c0_g1~~TRINITY_DN105699_c0_g1_i1.p1  ORF type:complete len:408 (+),score=63.13 TRINITY_DN105699_c0_g1_i1:45-1268(+)